MTWAFLVDLATALGVHPRVMLNEAEMEPASPGRPPKGQKSHEIGAMRCRSTDVCDTLSAYLSHHMRSRSAREAPR